MPPRYPAPRGVLLYVKGGLIPVMGEVSWRAWLGMGDAERMAQIDVAEFRTAAAARAWLERRLASARSRPGMVVFGSIDRGTYRAERPGAPPSWQLEHDPGAMDANVVDGRVSWQRPGRCCVPALP